MAVYNWSKTTPANNGTADPTINFAPQMAPSAVSPSGRALMTAIAQFRDDIAGSIVTTGTSTGYVVASNSGFDTIAHLAGQLIAFTPHVTNAAGPVTISVDGLGPFALRSVPNVELPAGVIIQGTPYMGILNQADGAIYLHGFFGNPYNVPIGASLEYWGPTAPNSSFAFPFGQAISRTIYASLFSGNPWSIGTTYGAGDGSTTFNLPDVRGRLTPAMDNMGGAAAGRLTNSGTGNSGINGSALGATGGAQSEVLVTANLPPYTPAGGLSLNSGSLTGNYNGGTPVIQGSGSGLGGGGSFGISGGTGVTISGAPGGSFTGTAQGGASTPVVTMPPLIVCNRILRII